MRNLVGVGLVITLTGCGGEATTAPITNPVGTFALSTVDAKALPASFGPTESGGPWYVRGTVDVRADGSYTQTVVDSSRSTGLGTVVEVGKWAQPRIDSLTMTATTSGRESAPAIFGGTTLARKQVTHVFAYRRR